MDHIRLLTLAAVCAGMAARVGAVPELAPLFQDHAVLQSGVPVPVWGRAAPGEHVNVAFAGQKIGATAGPDGRWIAVLAPLTASPLGAELVVTGKATVAAHDVLVGEVWLCCGGAAIEEGLAASGPAEVAAARFPSIRQFKVARHAASAPTDAAGGSWEACSPETAGGFTAVGYFFARELFSRLGVPVGIVDSAWAGAPLEAWMSPAALAAFPGVPLLPARADPSYPTSLFNGMIHPLLPYAIRGAIWWQADGEMDRPADYALRFPAMITAWRSHFGEGDFPFLWVQLADPKSTGASRDERWARLREAQAEALALPATGQAAAMDLGDGGKSEVARRLALIAKATVGRGAGHPRAFQFRRRGAHGLGEAAPVV
jgi:sialate O-acetylesterase